MIHVRMRAHAYTCARARAQVHNVGLRAFGAQAVLVALFYVCDELALDKVDCLIIKLMNTVGL